MLKVSYVTNSIKEAVLFGAPEHNGPSVSEYTVNWDACTIPAGQTITAPIFNRWPVEISWCIIIFVVRTIGTCK